MITGAVLRRKDGIAVLSTHWFDGYVVWLVSFALLRVLTGKMPRSFSVPLDERERGWRHRVSYLVYQVLTVLMLAETGYLLAIDRRQEAALHGAIMVGGLLVLGCPVPTIILGWALPDDDPEDSVA
jgi:hypothetical protein